MGLFGFSQPPDINKGIEEYQSTEGAVLLDVRNIGEYAQGHIEGSINIPLPCIIDIKDKVTDRSLRRCTYRRRICRKVRQTMSYIYRC